MQISTKTLITRFMILEMPQIIPPAIEMQIKSIFKYPFFTINLFSTR